MSVCQCPGCGFRYDEAKGEPHDGFAPCTRLSEIPEDLSCPDCGVRDFIDFEMTMDAVFKYPSAQDREREPRTTSFSVAGCEPRTGGGTE